MQTVLAELLSKAWRNALLPSAFRMALKPKEGRLTPLNNIEMSREFRQPLVIQSAGTSRFSTCSLPVLPSG